MRNNLKLFQVNTEYIRYLASFQEHIWSNESNGRKRPYVGVVLNIEGTKFFAPLTSPKQKHTHLKEGLDIIKITHKAKLICVVNLNNMIPVQDADVTLIDIKSEDPQYALLLQTELIELRKKQNKIIQNAKILYKKTTTFRKEESNNKLVMKCYNFELLEKKCIDYHK